MGKSKYFVISLGEYSWYSMVLFQQLKSEKATKVTEVI